MQKSTQELTLTMAAEMLKKEKINFFLEKNFLTAQKIKKTKSGQKLEIKLILENSKVRGILGYVRGNTGTPLIAIPAEQAINAYIARHTDLKTQ